MSAAVSHMSGACMSAHAFSPMALRCEAKLPALVVYDRSVVIAEARREDVFCSVQHRLSMLVAAKRACAERSTACHCKQHRSCSKYNLAVQTCLVALLKGFQVLGNVNPGLFVDRTKSSFPAAPASPSTWRWARVGRRRASRHAGAVQTQNDFDWGTLKRFSALIERGDQWCWGQGPDH